MYMYTLYQPTNLPPAEQRCRLPLGASQALARAPAASGAVVLLLAPVLVVAVGPAAAAGAVLGREEEPALRRELVVLSARSRQGGLPGRGEEPARRPAVEDQPVSGEDRGGGVVGRSCNMEAVYRSWTCVHVCTCTCSCT